MYKAMKKQHEFFSFVLCTELLWDSVQSEHWSVLCPLLCGSSHSAASRGSHMCQLSFNSHMEFLTASIMNLAVSLVPVCKLTASLRTHTLLYRKYTNSFSKQISQEGFLHWLYLSCLMSFVPSPGMLCRSLCSFSSTRCLNETVTWRTGAVSLSVWVRMELSWNKNFSQNLLLHQALILNSGIQENVVKNVEPKWLYASKFRQAAYHRQSGLLDIGP